MGDATLQETSSLQSGVSLRSFSRMDPVQEFNLEAGMGLLLHSYQDYGFLLHGCQD